MRAKQAAAFMAVAIFLAVDEPAHGAGIVGDGAGAVKIGRVGQGGG